MLEIITMKLLFHLMGEKVADKIMLEDVPLDVEISQEIFT
jgi:hypothetical protein